MRNSVQWSCVVLCSGRSLWRAIGKPGMKLIVGLGNPGRKYVGTRHNVGVEIVAELARRYATAKPKEKFKGEAVEASLQGQQVLLLCPQTYMNRSGSSVQPARDFYRIDNHDLLIVCDDINLPVPRLRFRSRGSSGGQKGLGDIIRVLGTEEIPRLRFGIGPAPERWDVSDFVLSRFTAEEQDVVTAAIQRAADAAADWASQGMQYCMNQYNPA